MRPISLTVGLYILLCKLFFAFNSKFLKHEFSIEIAHAFLIYPVYGSVFVLRYAQIADIGVFAFIAHADIDELVAVALHILKSVFFEEVLMLEYIDILVRSKRMRQLVLTHSDAHQRRTVTDKRRTVG